MDVEDGDRVASVAVVPAAVARANRPEEAADAEADGAEADDAEADGAEAGTAE
jgi:hypothetical protein